MSTGLNQTLTGNLTINDRYELSAEDDILTINEATISLVVPGDIFTNEGNDSVTIRGSQLSGAEGTSLFLGSGDDVMTVENSTLDVDVLAGSGNDEVTIAGSVSLGENKRLSLGSGNDVLTINGTLDGKGNLDFAAGNDTLRFDGGTLKTTGAVDNLTTVEVATKGGMLGRDLALASGENTMLLAGKLSAADKIRVLNFENATITVSVLGNAVFDNVRWYIKDASPLTQAEGLSGATLTFQNERYWGGGGAIFLGDNAVMKLHDVAFVSNTASAYLTATAINGGAVNLGASAVGHFTNANFSGNLAYAYACPAATAFGGAVNLGASAVGHFTNANFSGNLASALADFYAYATAFGGAVNLGASAVGHFTSANFSGNHARAFAWDGKVFSTAFGGAVNLGASAVGHFTNANFSGNLASASASASANGSAYATAFGGAVNLGASAVGHFTNANFSGNSVYASGYRRAASASASAYGGAVNLGASAVGHFTNANFSGNSAYAYAYGSAATAFGGAVNLGASAVGHFTNAKFSGNRASADVYGSAYGGAVYGTKAIINYSVQNENIINTGNTAASGGFLYADNCSVLFDVDAAGSLTIGQAGQAATSNGFNLDGIAGTGTIAKDGGGVMTIYSDIAGYTGQWTVAGGELQLFNLVRTIDLQNWGISAGAQLTLSDKADTVNLSGMRNLAGVLDFGGGNDKLDTKGNTLSGGELLLQNLTVSGGGTVQSVLRLRNADEAMSLTLAGVTLDSRLVGGNAGDTVTVSASSTINGVIDLGLGKNRVVVNSDTTISSEVLLTAGGTTEVEVFRGASLSENVLTARFGADSELTRIDFAWASIPDLDKVRILISDDPTFKTYEFAVGLYNQSKSFTLYTEGTNFLQFQVQDEDGWRQQLLPDEEAPGEVTGLEVAYREGQPVLTWEAAHDNLGGNGVAQYRLQFASDDAFGTILDETTIDSLEFAITQLAQGEYFVRVRAEDHTGNAGAWSSAQSFDFDNTPPETPVIQVSEAEPTNQNVTITATFSADSVLKQYSLDGGQSWLDYTDGIVFEENGTIQFRALDDHDNVSEIASYDITNIDKVAPEKPAVSASTTAPTNQDVTVTATFSADTAVKQYSYNNKDWSTYTAGLAIAKNGKVYFRGIDAAGNVSEVTEYNVTNIDKVAPEAPIASANITALTNQDVTVTAIFSADTDAKQYSYNNRDWSAYASGVVMSVNGTVYFRGIDAAGNISAVTTYKVANIDKVAPKAPVATADITSPTNRDVTVTATFSADSAARQYSYDASDWSAYVSGLVMSVNGTVYFRGIDAAGNVSAVTAYAVTNIDKVAPEKPAVSASTTAPTNQDVTVTATFSADTETKQYSHDNKDWNAYVSGVVMTENGSIYFRGIDAAGNVSEVAKYTVTNIDKVAPEAPSASANITTATQKNVVVTATFSQDTIYSQYSIDGQNWVSYTMQNVVMHENGTVWFRGIDMAGNISEVTSYEVANIDRIAPDVPSVSADITELTNQDVTVLAVFSDDSAQKQYSLDNKTWQNYAAGVMMASNGTVWFRGIDEAGNISPVTAYEVSNIDKVAPDAPTAKANTTAMTKQNVTVTATYSADTATKQYSTDNKTWKKYTKGIAMSANGALYFRGVDAAGNVSEVTEYAVNNIDKTAPVAVGGLSAQVTKNTITFYWTGTNDNLSGVAKYEIQVSDTADFSQVVASKSGAALTSFNANFTVSGTYHYRVRATDAVGNVSEWTSASIAFDFVDSTPPTKPTGLQLAQNGTKVTFSWKASTDADSGVAGYELKLVRNDHTETITQVAGTSVTLDLVESNYSWSVAAKDNFGNVSEAVSGENFRLLLPVGTPKQINLSQADVAELGKGTKSDEVFKLAADSAWGTYHVAQWNGGDDAVDLVGFNRFYDAVFGNGGYDAVQLPNGDNGLLYSDLLSPVAAGVDASARFSDIAEIIGNSGKDVIDLTDAAGGYAGEVLLKGGAGDDHLWAGKGDDILVGGAGDDDLRGGAGDDLYLFGENWGRDTILDDGGTLVFDNALKDKLSFRATGDGTRITDGTNAVELTWQISASEVVFADVSELMELRRDTIKGFLA